MPLLPISTGVVFVGAGPAGLSPLFAAATAGRLRDLLARGVVILERGDRIGCGALPGFEINSDSTAASFLDILTRSDEPSLRALRWHPLAEQLASLGTAAAPLGLVGHFLELAGNALCDLVAASERGAVLRRAEVIAVQRTGSGRWRTRFRHGDRGLEHEIESTAVVLALGASQPEDRLQTEQVAGLPLLPRFEHRVMQSGDLLARGGLQRAAARLRGVVRPRVVIVGGSTSAGASAARLLHPTSPIRFGPGDLVLLHRKPLRIFYNSVSEAFADGYVEFREQDVCSLTGRVYRFSGFRLDSRELVMAVRGIGNRPKEGRLRVLQLLPEHEGQAQECLGEADLIVAALGYRPRRLPILTEEGQAIPLMRPFPPLWATVDASCRLRTEQGIPLDNLYSIGLAVGPAPTQEMGGELDFHGQVNSLWMWQHLLGLRIATGLLEALPVPQYRDDPSLRVSRRTLLSEVPRVRQITARRHATLAENGGMQ